MFGAILRLLAAGEAGRRLGDYVNHLKTKYLVLGAAGMISLVAIVFAILAIFWGLISLNHNPAASAGIMAGALGLIGLLTVFIGFGITQRKPQSASQALRYPVQTVQSEVPSVENIGRFIERSARDYGALRVTAAAAAGGLVAGLLAKRFGQMGGYVRLGQRRGRRPALCMSSRRRVTPRATGCQGQEEIGRIGIGRLSMKQTGIIECKISRNNMAGVYYWRNRAHLPALLR